MADMKKFLSTEGLSALVDQIKAEDAKVKAYADSLGSNYDAAGLAATKAGEALASAQTYTDNQVKALADGTVKGNSNAIMAIMNDPNIDSFAAVTTELAKKQDVGDYATKAEAQAMADEKDTAIAEAKAAGDAAQGDVDDLAAYVGTFTASEGVDTVVKYIDAKTANIASDETVGAIANRVTQAEKDIDAIEADYLKSADRTALEGQIEALQTAVDTEKGRAEGIESGLETRLKAVEDDYLKAADKTELQGNIDTVAGAVERLTNGVSADEVDGVNDLIKYVKEHGTEVTGMQEDISKNAEDIAGVAGRMTTAEGKITAVEGAVATKAEKTYVDEQVQALQGVDTGLDNRLKAVEAAVGESGSVSDDIATAKQEAIDAAAADATSKANTAESNAKSHADSLNTAMNTRVEALEAIDHDHTNKAELDLIATGDKAKWDTAAGKAHEHSNLTVLEGITSAKVTAWDAAEGNAKTYADGLNTTMQSTVDGIDERVSGLEEASATHALASDLTAAVERIAANETAIAANTSAINSFTAITPDEVNALFA